MVLKVIKSKCIGGNLQQHMYAIFPSRGYALWCRGIVDLSERVGSMLQSI